MRRFAALGLSAALAASLAPVASADRLTQVGVRGIEFDLTPTRSKVDAGSAKIQFQNDGEDPHDLIVQRKGRTKEVTTGTVLPGESSDLSLKLKRDSTYVMWCSISDHRAKGMETKLKVRKN